MLFLLTRLTPRISESKRLRASSHDFVLIKVKKSVEKANVHGHVHPPPPFHYHFLKKGTVGRVTGNENIIDDRLRSKLTICIPFSFALSLRF